MTAMHPDVAKALALLAVGHSMQAAAERVSWPIGSIRALINGQTGWLVHPKTACVYDPGQPGNQVRIPESINEELLDWARKQGNPASAEPAKPARPAKPAPVVPATVFTEPTPDAKPASRPAPGPTQVVEIPLDQIHDHPGNIRDTVGDISELAASIREHGLMQPLTVQPHPDKPDHYQLLAGHRRRAAAVEAGLATVPAVIRRDVDEATAIELMIVENVQRADLGPIEKAEAFGRLQKEHGYTATRIAKNTGLSQATVSRSLALLDLDVKTRDRVRRGELAVGDALDLVKRHRAKARKQAGGGRTDWTWEPDYLTHTHPLAKKAAKVCDTREHTGRRRLGDIACGQCWEYVIRADERLAAQATREES
ncbi:ParB/RepB/Spo0J family partition protein [Nonomuraea sp. bgisy101]|uniref:ParB/RepB/Spo0J family partition protein n=1 Tax=Nonomuraea sp. bgisy101 TaxID=3413784 RepID=UPI003D730051